MIIMAFRVDHVDDKGVIHLKPKYKRVCNVDRRTNQCGYCHKRDECTDVQKHLRR